MKTTKELFKLDAKQFKGMLYEDVLTLKAQQARRLMADAHIENFKLGFKHLSIADQERVKTLDIITKEQEKALQYLTMWQREME